ncbi:ribosomal rRNA processing protein 45 [Trypanosoma rangeli]|uniref:Ribosomal rRNA processing protein 45 n=1 Tax=Trypanosoma rangeli TaxID=5698 RepID=A0A3R7LNR5_TRYRA|nr:ribosomal rRNA processing protein 45 [Trypanosoma rangeli]RNF00499.1 ribosomal rRNA processing protein 45 [Trypanosoma rangeli]|eukprot:RNF00499.1 ribosomal rRNA processing protein 45 [Trypanosoma rangeli]
MLQRCAFQTIASPALTQREVEFTKSAWLAGLRPDQRGAQQLREVKVEFPLLSRDVACVRCGGTIVTAAIACELVEPSPYRPKQGMLEFSVRQPYTERDSGAKSRELKTLTAFLERLIKTGGVVDTESLCMLPGRRVWSVSVDITVLNDEGNVTDVVVWATVAVLLHYRRPELTIRGNSVIVHPPHEREPVPLSVHHVPLPFSFVVTMDPSDRNRLSRQHKDNKELLEVVVDPTVAEATAAASSVVVAVNAEGQVCSVSKSEGCCIHLNELNYCMETAALLAPRVLSLIREAMAAHDVRRQEALQGQFLWVQKRSGVGRDVAVPETTKKARVET